MGQRIVKSLRKSMMVNFKKLKSATVQVVVGQLETARIVEVTRKSGRVVTNKKQVFYYWLFFLFQTRFLF